MKNWYDEKLEKYNQEILALIPANETLRKIMAIEFKRLYKKGDRVLDLGCGEGDSAELLLKYTKAYIDALDISPSMIKNCQRNLAKYKKRIKYICADAEKHLRKSKPYNFILSSWTLHNFNQGDKKKILKSILEKLVDGGYFFLFDKVYPVKGGRELLELQLKRYRYLDPNSCKGIIDHEKKDHTEEFRMEEKSLLKLLKEIGFSKVMIVDRVERDVVLIAKK